MERRHSLRSHTIRLVALAAALACRPADRASRPPRDAVYTVTDDAGRTVALAQPARRIVSLSPAVTELLFALGVGDRVVGRTTWCDYRLGIPAAVLRQDRLEDVARAARLLGRVVGRAAAGDSLADALGRLLAAPVPPSGPRLAFVVWDNPPMVIGSGSYLDQLATLAGAENVFHDLGAASAAVALETIATRDPDVIVVVSDSAEPRPPAFARRREWRVIRAVREGRFVYLVGSLFGRPGPRVGVAAAELRRLLGQVKR